MQHVCLLQLLTKMRVFWVSWSRSYLDCTLERWKKVINSISYLQEHKIQKNWHYKQFYVKNSKEKQSCISHVLPWFPYGQNPYEQPGLFQFLQDLCGFNFYHHNSTSCTICFFSYIQRQISPTMKNTLKFKRTPPLASMEKCSLLSKGQKAMNFK